MLLPATTDRLCSADVSRRINSHIRTRLLLARLMGQYCFARWRLLSVVIVCRLSSSVTLPAGGRAGGRERGRTASQYGCVPLGRHLITVELIIAVACCAGCRRL